MKEQKESKRAGLISVTLAALIAVICMAAVLVGCVGETPDVTDTDTKKTGTSVRFDVETGGAKDTEGAQSAKDTESTEDAESSEDIDSSSEGDTEPVTVYGSFEVLEATDENIASFDVLKKHDVSSSEHSFSLILVAARDVADLAVTRLTWNYELLLEAEDVTLEIGEVKTGEAVLLTCDTVEIMGYTGISYTLDGETLRYYPATDGRDGSPVLVEIGSEFLSLDLLYPDLEIFEVTVSEDTSLEKALFGLSKNDDGEYVWDFYNEEPKLVRVNGLSEPLYLEFVSRWHIGSVMAYGHVVRTADRWRYSSPRDFSLLEYEGAVILAHSSNAKGTDTLVFTDAYVTEAYPEDGISLRLCLNDDGKLGYFRENARLASPETLAATAPLELALSRDDLFRESGMAHIEKGRLVLEEPFESLTVGEAYDLDALFEEYKLNYLGYESADEVLERNRKRKAGEEGPLAHKTVMPNESYIGNWGDLLNSIDIYEVTADTVRFRLSEYKLFDFDGTATLTDGEWVFVEDRKFITDEDKVKGWLKFTENTVSVGYDTWGRFGSANSGHTFSRHVASSENGRVYSGLITVCNGSGSSYLGLYSLTVPPTEENYIIIADVNICNGSCVQMSMDPIAEYGTEDGWQYPVKVYKSEYDESIKDVYPAKYIEGKRTAIYVFDIREGMHFKLTVTRYDADHPFDPLDNEMELLEKIVKGCHLEYTLLNSKTGEAYPTVGK